MYSFLPSFFHGWMLRICPQYNAIASGGAFVPLRGGISENALSKGRKSDSRHLRQCLDGVFVNEGNIIFRGVI